MSEDLKNNELAEFINEIRHICQRYKDGDIKDWGRLRTIIGNLVGGACSDYYFDMHKENPLVVKIKELTEREAKLSEALISCQFFLGQSLDDTGIANRTRAIVEATLSELNLLGE